MIKRLLGLPAWLKLLAYFAIWRSVLFVVGAHADNFLKYKPSFPYVRDYLYLSFTPKWLYSWGNFDGVHYLGIAQNGYKAAYVQAFFPVLPISMKLVGYLTGKNLTAGLLITNLMAAVFCIVWYLVVKSWRSSRIALISLLIVTLFPTALFMGAIYTESIFLVLILLCFWLAVKKNWLLAGVCAGLASATRIVGICLVPALIIEWADQQGYLNRDSLRNIKAHFSVKKLPIFMKRNWRFLGGLTLGCIGLASYMLYLYMVFHDPLYFAHVQSDFGAGRESNLVLYPQVIWRSFKILLTSRPFDLRYFVYIQEFVAGVGGGLLLILTAWQASKRQQKWSHWVFALLAFILPTTTGTFSSMGRYVLVCFIFWLSLAEYLSKHRWLMIGYFVLSIVLLLINTVLFVQGYWVA